jgi:predicted nucleic acid-binding protein
MVTPSATVFDRAGEVLQRLAEGGREIRRASLTHDVLIALSARAIGATVITRDADFVGIAAITPFDLHLIP